MLPGINGCQAYEEIIKFYPDQKAIRASGFSATRENRNKTYLKFREKKGYKSILAWQ